MSDAALALSREIIREKSKSFYLASRLLPHVQRDAATIVYAWCRRADDTVDEAGGEAGGDVDTTDTAGDVYGGDVYGGKRAALARLHLELDDIEAGNLPQDSDVIVVGFAQVVRRHRIPLMYPRELLRGMEADLGAVRYQTMDELMEYCYRVAGTVGLMMCHVMGVDDDAAIVNAAHLGVAMQLTNICRDVVEDWHRGRQYLPDELLARHGVGGLGQGLGGPLPESALPGLADAVRELLQLAERYYRSGDAGLERLPWRSSVAIAAARRIYAEIGAVLAARDYDVSAGRAFVTTRRKLHLVASCLAERSRSLRARGLRRARFARPSRSLPFAEMPRP